MQNVKYKLLTPFSLVDLTTGQQTDIPCRENCKLSIDGIISQNPQFRKSKRLLQYQKAKEHLDDCSFDLDGYQHKIRDRDNIKRFSFLNHRWRTAREKVEQLKESFIYDRKNSSKDGFTLNDNSRKRLKRNLYWLYQRNDQDGVKFLWYTFTVPKRFTGVAYRPEHHDRLVSNQFQKLLESLRKNWGVRDYIFVAERQDGKRKKDKFQAPTNAIHFHIVFVQDEKTYLDVQRVNFYWCCLLGKVGFEFLNLESIDKGIAIIEKDINLLGNLKKLGKVEDFQYLSDMPQLERSLAALQFLKKSKGDYTKIDHFIPRDFMNQQKGVFWYKVVHNPVDCELITSFKKLGTYIAKYLSKSDKKIYCRVWSQTRYFSALRTDVMIPLELAFSEIVVRHQVKSVTVVKEIHGIKYTWYRKIHSPNLWNHPLLKAYKQFLLYEQTNKTRPENSKAYYQNKLWVSD